MDIMVVTTRTGCQYRINKSEKNVTGGYFGRDTVPYTRAVFHGLGQQMIFFAGDHKVLTAPVKSVSNQEIQMSF